MPTTHHSKLASLYNNLPSGVPLTSDDLAKLGISADLAVHYARSGWLRRLARGIYCRPDAIPALYPSLRLLQRKIDGFHVGGKSALDWYGLRQYVSQQSLLHAYGWTSTHLPEWFVREFPSEYHQKRLFREDPRELLCVAEFEGDSNAPLVSSPERAVLELLSEVAVRQPLQEAREIVEGTNSMRADVLERLLLRCTSVKTVRLCLQLGKELDLPWASKLDVAKFPTGSDQPWVSRSEHGLLVLRP